MAAKSSFFSRIIAFFLVVIIIGGVGFLGYNLFSNSMAGMDMSSMSKGSDTKTADKSKDEQASQSKGSSMDNMNMSGSSSKDGGMDMSGTSSKQDGMNMTGSKANSNAQYATVVINGVLQNKDLLDKTLVTLNDSLKLMTLDPYGVEVKNNTTPGSGNVQTQDINGQKTPANGTSAQSSTIVNVYPQNAAPQMNTMQNMGTTYDVNKMEKLHTGLYKISVGMQLLDQLRGNLSSQVEAASMEVKNPSQYYYNQYLTTVQNKNKLTDAIAYVNEASTLVNINPYIAQNGAVYDKERMSQIHESIYKLAQAVVELNKLNDNFSKQSITLSNLTQTYVNNDQSMQGMDMSGSGFNLFGNLNMTTVLNILVIAFVVIFVISILGYISHLFKTDKRTE